MVLNRFSYKRSDKTIVLSEYAKNNLQLLKIRNVIVIPNALSFKKPEKYNFITYKRIIAVGRLEYVKGFDLLINSFSMISKKFPDWKIVIYGDGSCRKSLEQLISSLKMNNQIILTGSSKQIVDEYDKADIFALSSRDESFGLVLTEAMESSLPIVAYDIPAVREIISDDCSLVIEKYNVEEYAKALEKFMKDDEYRIDYAKHAKKHVEEYSIDIICEKWRKLFEELY